MIGSRDLAAVVVDVAFDIQNAAVVGFHQPGVFDRLVAGIDRQRLMAAISIDCAGSLVIERQVTGAVADMAGADDVAVVVENAAIPGADNVVFAARQD